jgi:hypothetical protein
MMAPLLFAPEIAGRNGLTGNRNGPAILPYSITHWSRGIERSIVNKEGLMSNKPEWGASKAHNG